MSVSYPVLRCGSLMLPLDRPRVMGILNVTPDSFSDGGRFIEQDAAFYQAERMLLEGADIIDIGGESTRPGAAPVTVQQELDRVLPIIRAIAERFETVISIDTSKAEVMCAAAEAGAGFINDVRALQEPGALQAAAATQLPVCLMHMQGQPRTMQTAPQYANVVHEVIAFLESRRDACIEAGIDKHQIVFDPGFGFGKTLAHNTRLLAELNQLGACGPVLAGLSRKSMLAGILGDDHADRMTASVTGAVLCVQRGASIVRVHDVEPTVQALKVYAAIEAATEAPQA